MMCECDVFPACSLAQPVLSLSKQPKKNQAEGGTTKIKVNPTILSDQMDHPVLVRVSEKTFLRAKVTFRTWNGSPVKPLGHLQMATWRLTSQSAPLPQVVVQGSTQL